MRTLANVMLKGILGIGICLGYLYQYIRVGFRLGEVLAAKREEDER